jgi:amidase
MEEFLKWSGTRQARLIREGGVSSRELVAAHLRQIERINPVINAAVEIFGERALAEADAADDALRRGGAIGPLHGVPFSIKDSIEVAGAQCTAGTTGRRTSPPSCQDATLVARLRGAGAVPIARTNLPDLLFSFETDNLIFGRTNNPYAQDRTSGGSSGGEAALQAACGSPFGLGSDAAGSVRVPAAFCGTASIKPTSGRLPRTGHFPPAGGWIEALWQIGPMARRVEDLITLMPILAGSDGRDHTVIDMPLHDPAQVEVERLRIAFYTGNGLAPADDEVARVVRSAAGRFPRATEARPSCLPAAYDLEMKLLGADGGDGLRDYMRELGSAEAHPLLTGWLDKLEAYRTDLAGFHAYWDEWQGYRAETRAFLGDYDVVLCPAYTHAALPHGTSIEEANFRGFSHTMAYNVAGVPAAVVRCGATEAGLPVAVQIVARAWREDLVLAVALRLEEIFGGWQQPPKISGPE